MTLIVTLNTPDGIVIAGDSLATMTINKFVEGDFNVQCPECKNSTVFKGRIANAHFSNTLSHAQKIFPFMEKYGVATFGLGQIHGKTIYFALKELEQCTKNQNKSVENINEIANLIGTYIQELILKQIRQETQNNKLEIQEDIYPLGFQIVGYDAQKAITIEMHIGR